MKASFLGGLALSLSQLVASTPVEKRALGPDDLLGLDLSNIENPAKCTPEQATIVKETIRKVAYEFIPHARDNLKKAWHKGWGLSPGVERERLCEK
jgi:hypothetical protein